MRRVATPSLTAASAVGDRPTMGSGGSHGVARLEAEEEDQTEDDPEPRPAVVDAVMLEHVPDTPTNHDETRQLDSEEHDEEDHEVEAEGGETEDGSEDRVHRLLAAELALAAEDFLLGNMTLDSDGTTVGVLRLNDGTTLTIRSVPAGALFTTREARLCLLDEASTLLALCAVTHALAHLTCVLVLLHRDAHDALPTFEKVSL